jgi:hypothetical protein
MNELEVKSILHRLPDFLRYNSIGVFGARGLSMRRSIGRPGFLVVRGVAVEKLGFQQNLL